MIGIATRFSSVLALTLSLGLAPAWAGPTLDKIKQAGTVVCGVNTGLAGFGQPDSQGTLFRVRRRYLQGDRRGGVRRSRTRSNMCR